MIAAAKRAARGFEVLEKGVHRLALADDLSPIRVVQVHRFPLGTSVDPYGRPAMEARVLDSVEKFPLRSRTVQRLIGLAVLIRQGRAQPRPQDDRHHIAFGGFRPRPVDGLLRRQSRIQRRRVAGIVPGHRLDQDFPGKSALRGETLQHLPSQTALIGHVTGRGEKNSNGIDHCCGPRSCCIPGEISCSPIHGEAAGLSANLPAPPAAIPGNLFGRPLPARPGSGLMDTRRRARAVLERRGPGPCG